jgi:hypothetical protein
MPIRPTWRRVIGARREIALPITSEEPATMPPEQRFAHRAFGIRGGGVTTPVILAQDPDDCGP